MNYQKGNTTNTILVILLVIVAGFVVWYVTIRNKQPADTGTSIDVNLGSGSSNGSGGGYSTP